MKKSNEEIMKEILGRCNWYEKIILKSNKRLFIKIYHTIRKDLINSIF